MTLRRLLIGSAAALLLVTCTSCQTEDLDSNGDGQVTRAELLSAIFDHLCGDSTETSGSEDETPQDEETDEEGTNDTPTE